MLLIPVRSTSYLQPLDVSINKPFKSAMRDNWDDWFDSANEFTKNGNLKRASYGSVVDWVHFANQSISSDIIRNSFHACGISKTRVVSLLNCRLKEILGEQVTRLYIEDLDWDEEDEDLIKNNIEVEILEEI